MSNKNNLGWMNTLKELLRDACDKRKDGPGAIYLHWNLPKLCIGKCYFSNQTIPNGHFVSVYSMPMKMLRRWFWATNVTWMRSEWSARSAEKRWVGNYSCEQISLFLLNNVAYHKTFTYWPFESKYKHMFVIIFSCTMSTFTWFWMYKAQSTNANHTNI